jgi:hypothetical protein
MSIPICVPCQIEKGSEDPSFAQSHLLHDLSCYYCGRTTNLGLFNLCECGGMIDEGHCFTCGKEETI